MNRSLAFPPNKNRNAEASYNTKILIKYHFIELTGFDFGLLSSCCVCVVDIFFSGLFGLAVRSLLRLHTFDIFSTFLFYSIESYVI